MQTIVDELIARLVDRLRYSPAVEMDANYVHTNDKGEVLPSRRANPPLELNDVDYVETQLGFQLPEIVRRISLEVADGGFGPNWGISRLKHPAKHPFGPPHEVEMSVESWHRLHHDPKECGDWLADFPDRFIRYCDVGCNITLCVDCMSPAGLLFMDDPMAKVVKPMNETVEQWLTRWLDEVPWPETMYS